MDWISWLSRTSLDPSLIYQYGVEFDRNELQKEDLTYFNHEFLQSMGISVAKHRLEILKLARNEIGGGSRKFSKLVSALNKTRKNVAKRINKLIFHDETIKSLPDPIRHQEEQWKGAILTRKYKSEREIRLENPALRTRRIAKSGPLDGRVVQEKLIQTNKSLKLSGPLDRNMQESLLFTYRSPISSGPLDGRTFANKSPNLSGTLNKRPPSPRVYTDCNREKLDNGCGGGYDDNTLWAALFQDLKPT